MFKKCLVFKFANHEVFEPECRRNREAQKGPKRTRKGQKGPEKAKKDQKRPKRARKGQKAKKGQKGPKGQKDQKIQKRQVNVLECSSLEKASEWDATKLFNSLLFKFANYGVFEPECTRARRAKKGLKEPNRVTKGQKMVDQLNWE